MVEHINCCRLGFNILGSDFCYFSYVLKSFIGILTFWQYLNFSNHQRMGVKRCKVSYHFSAVWLSLVYVNYHSVQQIAYTTYKCTPTNCCVRHVSISCTKILYTNIIYFQFLSFTLTLLSSLVGYYFVFCLSQYFDLNVQRMFNRSSNAFTIFVKFTF